MDPARPDPPTPTPIPRYRLRTPSPALHAPAADNDSLSLSLPLDKHTTRPAMTNAHRRFHRRAPPATNNVLTIEVEVVATLDAAGNVVPSATVTRPAPALSAAPSGLADNPLPATPLAVSPPPVAAAQSVLQTPPAPAAPTAIAAPAVPAVPSPPTLIVPSVPSVPAFPSDLTVPAYPFASGVPLASAAAEQFTAAALSVDVSLSLFTPSPSSLPESNLTMPSSSLLPSSSSLLSVTTSPSASPTAFVVSVLNVPSSGSNAFSSVASVASETASTSSASDAAASISFYGGGGSGGGNGGQWSGNSATATSSFIAGVTAGASAADSQDTGPLDTPRVVGSVVGSLAGIALILAIILMLLRRHKRKQSGGALQLTGSNTTDAERPMQQVNAPAQNSLVPSPFLKRLSAMSRSTVDTSATGERSFQRVSGRKLPSAFSQGMTSEQFSRGGPLSGSSFYQDDHGTYVGSGVSKEYGEEFAKEIGDTSGAVAKMSMRPSPARTPIIRHPEDNPFADSNRSTLSTNPFSDMNRSTLSPPQSPNPEFPSRAALGRSLHSADGSRSSRFTENV